MSATELVKLGEDILPRTRVCKLLEVPRSSYYEQRLGGRRAARWSTRFSERTFGPNSNEAIAATAAHASRVLVASETSR